MPTPIVIEADGLSLEAELNDSVGARSFIERLPVELSLSRWGEEYYGACGLSIEQDASAKEIMDVGELALWPPGKALCIFFGKTPASTDERPRAASPVVPIGMVTADVSPLSSLGSTIRITVRKA